MSTMLQDARYGVRMLRKRPGFTVVAVITLGLGIGANTAIFSVINAILLRPLPFAHPERIVSVVENNLSKGWEEFTVSVPNFIDFRDQSQSFDEIAAMAGGSFNLVAGGEPERIRGTRASASLFSMLDIIPVQGRVFTAEENQTGRDNVVVMSYSLWQRRFAGDPGVIGQAITLNNQSFTVIGIMPPDFQFPNRSDMWVPFAFNSNTAGGRGAHYLNVISRLKPGVSIAQARTEMQGIAQRLEQQYPQSNTGWGANVVFLMDRIVGEIRPALMILLGAVAFVLLIACANVANLLLARAATRQKEISIRTALGASRSHLIRQLLTESMLLALVGGGLGLLLAYWGVDLLVAASPENIPRVREIRVDKWVLVFTVAISVVTGIVFGLVPALQASKPDLNETLKEGGRGSTASRHRLRDVLVVIEVALALVLLIGAGLMIKSFLRLQQVNPGFNAENVLTLSVPLPRTKYTEPEKQAAFFRQLLQRAQTLPGVESASAVSAIPMSNNESVFAFLIEGRHTQNDTGLPDATYYAVSADYFKTLGIRLLKGRYFTEQDADKSTRVVIINETMARRYWPDEDPIGRRINITNGPQAFREIVGVVSDVREVNLSTEARPQMYEPYLQKPYANMALALRTTGEPTSLTAAVRTQVQELDSDQPISNISPLAQYVYDSIAQRRLSMILLGTFAAVALVLAVVGLYGVMAYSVTQRTHEIGIRMALGAKKSDVLTLVLKHGMGLTLLGVTIGVGAAFALTRVMVSLLYNVTATDPVTFLAIPFVLGAVALAASYIPARRAAKVDPMVALRYE